MGIKRFGILSFLKSAFDAMPATIEGQLMKIQDVLVSVNDCLDDVVDISHQPRARDVIQVMTSMVLMKITSMLDNGHWS